MAESIKNLSLYEENKVDESTEKILKRISINEHELLNLQKQLLKSLKTETLENQKTEALQFKILDEENKTLQAEIQKLKDQLPRYTNNRIPKQNYEKLHSEYLKLEKKYSNSFNENSLLQQSLLKIKNSNFSKFNNSLTENLAELSRILSDLSKISCLTRAYSMRTPVDYSNLLGQDSNHSSIQIYIEKIRKEVEKISLECTDIYAEQCGNNCYIQ